MATFYRNPYLMHQRDVPFAPVLSTIVLPQRYPDTAVQSGTRYVDMSQLNNAPPPRGVFNGLFRRIFG